MQCIFPYTSIHVAIVNCKVEICISKLSIPENQKYMSKISYIMLENTHVATNTSLKEDYKMAAIFIQL